jgi:AcrR family transcriptional regulator
MQEIKTISTYKQGLRDIILDSAMKAFAERGIRAVKMDDIAAALSISKRTLYEIYETKEQLLYEGVREYHERMTERMDKISTESDNVMEIMLKVYRLKVEEFRVTTPAFYSDLVKYPRVLRYLNRENQRTRVKSLRFLARGVDEGFFRDDVNYELAGRLFDALGRYVMSQQLYKQYTIEEIFNNLIFVTFRGLCTPKGIKALERFE